MIQTSQYVICTAICGDRDSLIDPVVVHEGVDYIAFVDREYDCKVWKQYPAMQYSSHEDYRNRRNAKIYKICPQLFLEGWEYLVWQDGNFETHMHPKDIVDTAITTDMAVFRHTKRTCAYHEARYVERCRLESPKVIEEQIQFYRSQGFPPQYGMYALGFRVLKNTDAVKLFNLMWLEQIIRFSSRDQISFPYVAWKSSMDFNTLKGRKSRSGYPIQGFASIRRKHTGTATQ